MFKLFNNQSSNRNMSDNFKYDDYDDDFEMNNPSTLQTDNKAQPKQNEP